MSQCNVESESEFSDDESDRKRKTKMKKTRSKRSKNWNRTDARDQVLEDVRDSLKKQNEALVEMSKAVMEALKATKN